MLLISQLYMVEYTLDILYNIQRYYPSIFFPTLALDRVESVFCVFLKSSWNGLELFWKTSRQLYMSSSTEIATIK